MNLAPTICEDCEKVFMGGPHSFLCDDCRKARLRKAAKDRGLSKLGRDAYSKQQKKKKEEQP